MRTFLFPVDVGHNVDHVVPFVAALARQQGAKIHLLHVLNEEDPEHYGDPMLFADWTAFEEHARKVIDRRLARILAMPDLADIEIECCVESGQNAWRGVLQVAERIGADLIVLPSRIKQASRERVVGSMANRLLNADSPPILLFSYAPDPGPAADDDEDEPPTAAPLFQRILVPSDGSIASEVVASRAAEIASAFGGRIIVLHVVEADPDPAGDEILREAFAQRAARIFDGPPVEIHIAHGKPSTVIPLFADANQIDLVFMACHGKHHPCDDFVGENTERVIRHITQPICVL